jgi:hypothetical protein
MLESFYFSEDSKKQISLKKESQIDQSPKTLLPRNYSQSSQYYLSPPFSTSQVESPYVNINRRSSSGHLSKTNENQLPKKLKKKAFYQIFFLRHQASIQIFFGLFMCVALILESVLSLNPLNLFLISLVLSWLFTMLIDKRLK